MSGDKVDIQNSSFDIKDSDNSIIGSINRSGEDKNVVKSVSEEFSKQSNIMKYALIFTAILALLVVVVIKVV